MNALPDARAIARRYGGTVNGNQVNIPTEGHGKKDRGTSITIDPAAPDGLLVHVHNGGDPLAVKDMLRRDGLLPERKVSRQIGAKPLFAKSARPAGVTCFEYQDADSRTACRKVRTDPGKKFTWQHPDGNGGWNAGRGCDALFYRLPDLIAAPDDAVIYFAEGEQKADKLAGWGLVATSSKDLPDDLGLLQGRRVVILPDNDTAGASIASKLAERLEGIAAQVVLIDLPGLPPSGDIVDWGGDAAELERLATVALEGRTAKAKPAYLRGISAAALMAKHFEPVNYVIPGLMAEGAWILAGPPKLGKSWLCYDFALAIAAGKPVFGSIPVAEGDVLYLALEDSERRLKSRLLKKGVRQAPERLTLATEWPGLDDGCIAELEAWADAVASPALVIVDVLKMVRGATKANESIYDADYRALTGLAQFARRRGIAVLVVHHTRKMAADDPLESISGTNGLTGASDGVMVLKRDIGTGHCILYGRGRDIEENETALQFNRDIGTWERLGAADEVGRTSERETIMAVLRESTKPLTARDISDICGKNYDAIRKTLARMAHAGEVEKTGRGLYACPNRPNVPNTPADTLEPDIGTHGTGYKRGEEQSHSVSWPTAQADDWDIDPFDPRTWEADP